MATTDEYRWQSLREHLGVSVELAVTERCADRSFTGRHPYRRGRRSTSMSAIDRGRLWRSGIGGGFRSSCKAGRPPTSRQCAAQKRAVS